MGYYIKATNPNQASNPTQYYSGSMDSADPNNTNNFGEWTLGTGEDKKVFSSESEANTIIANINSFVNSQKSSDPDNAATITAAMQDFTMTVVSE